MQTSSPGRTLVLMRHAKAEQDGPTDFERRLSGRGRADSAAAGAAMAAAGIAPDGALVSAATRARETWESVAGAAGWRVEPDLDRAVYTAWQDSLLDLIRLTEDTVTSLVVVGHNPTMESLAQLLVDDGDGGDPDATGLLLTQGFPTSGWAAFTVPGSWADLQHAGATLVLYGVGRA